MTVSRSVGSSRKESRRRIKNQKVRIFLMEDGQKKREIVQAYKNQVGDLENEITRRKCVKLTGVYTN